MIKFVCTQKNGRKIVGFGLSKGNVDKLKAGQPIYVLGEPLGFPEDFTIIYGETEDDMANELRSKFKIVHDEDYRKT